MTILEMFGNNLIKKRIVWKKRGDNIERSEEIIKQNPMLDTKLEISDADIRR